MVTHDWGSYNIQDILDKNPLQVWSFGPVLLDANGQPRDSYDISDAVSFPNPRSAIGYYEPGHYALVIVDGRQEGHSAGMRIPQLAQVFADLGCTAAYNLDGGGTAVMMFNGAFFSRQSNGGRDLGDILLITEAGYGEKEGQE
jgi:exopolysaccharide biosynthesis protein